jgi:type I restriction enzyme, R subunit
VTGEAFEQIKLYENEIPRLFYSNAFNIITNGEKVLYGTTHSPSQYYGEWKDPWPLTDSDFKNELDKGIYSLLEPKRLLDLLAHFIVFETDDGKTIKKICRYQQYRAVNKIVNRFLENRTPDDSKGLIWHTQGSGKSLTMLFTVLKLKKHYTLSSDKLSSPNILILTDRVDLDDQITKTFQDCKLPNPIHIKSINKLKESIHSDTLGLTVLSTIFKLSGSTKAVPNSDKWIILTDESHRTQEQDLGAYLHKTFPNAWFFGFTGTPIKSSDKNTYANFSPKGEMYLDKYSIDDAIADGATVPIHYMSRMAEWHLNTAEIDILFDQWFANESDEHREQIKQKGLTTSTLLKHSRRVELIAKDIWENYKTSAYKDGYKAQVVCVDREAIILYKRQFDKIISDEKKNEGIVADEALAIAESYTVPVYSGNQEDEKPSENSYIDSIRKDLKKYLLNDDKGSKFGGRKKKTSNPTETEVKTAFKKIHEPPYILIVCNKLLTGFDAPVESVMYLDSPLKEHNLLQAIARTNRVEGPNKQNGLIVDYVGVTKNLTDALSSYRKEDVQHAMHDIDELRSELKQAHYEVMQYLKDIKLDTPSTDKAELKAEVDSLLNALKTEDKWLTFKRKAKVFIKAYQALSPDPFVLDYKRDLKWVGLILPIGALRFEHEEYIDIKNYSGKIRQMLEEELTVSGIRDVIKVRSLNDGDFWKDFETEDKSDEDLETAAVRKATELKKTISDKIKDNAYQYGKFSDRLKEIIRKLQEKQMAVIDILKLQEDLANDIISEENEYKKSGLNKKAHGLFRILEAFMESGESPSKISKPDSDNSEATVSTELSELQQIASEIDILYTADSTAPIGWHVKEQQRKELRQKIRMMVFPLNLKEWKTIPSKVEEYALKHYVKL